VPVQPVPDRGNSVVMRPGQDLTRERRWLRRGLGPLYDESDGLVGRLTSQHPGLRGSARQDWPDAQADLIAAHAYLARGASQAVDRAVRGAAPGSHVPLARLAAAGLQRLPSYRGVARLRAAVTDAALDWYRAAGTVTEWAFCHALTAGRPGLPGDTDILLWSLTARRTGLLEPEVPDCVVFLPGTAFRVLRVTAGQGRRAILLREAPPAPAIAPGRLDQVALTLLDSALAGLAEGNAAGPLPPAFAGRFGSPPGLTADQEPGPSPAGQAGAGGERS
jgi:hypothetical protein